MPPVPALLAPEPGPRTLVEVRWGGSRLGPLRGAAGRAIGESWEFSTLAGRESRARGRPLPAVLGRPLDFLAKLIDTRLALSLQVHPPADPAAGWAGKEEAWIVLDAEPGAGMLAGLLPGVRREELAAQARAAAAGAPADALLALLRTIPVRRGSVVLVPSGTVHSIGAGILLAELQQPADRTCRLYDWGSDRPLEIEAALAAIDPRSAPQVWQPDERPRALRGAFVELAVLGPGSHAPAAGGDVLIVPVEGCCELRAAGESERIARGELRLCTGAALAIDVGEAGLAVIGRVTRA